MEIVKKYRYYTQIESVKEETYEAFISEEGDFYYRSKSGKAIMLNRISRYCHGVRSSLQRHINQSLSFSNSDTDITLDTMSYSDYANIYDYRGADALIFRAYSTVEDSWLYLMVNPATLNIATDDEEQEMQEEPINSPIDSELSDDPIEC
jgi:hypothetical protein